MTPPTYNQLEQTAEMHRRINAVHEEIRALTVADAELVGQMRSLCERVERTSADVDELAAAQRRHNEQTLSNHSDLKASIDRMRGAMLAVSIAATLLGGAAAAHQLGFF